MNSVTLEEQLKNLEHYDPTRPDDFRVCGESRNKFYLARGFKFIGSFIERSTIPPQEAFVWDTKKPKEPTASLPVTSASVEAAQTTPAVSGFVSVEPTVTRTLVAEPSVELD